MEFGKEEICHICRGYPQGRVHRYTSDMLGMDYAFYTCEGDCDKKFRGEYVDPFEPIYSRFEILDL